MSMSEELQAIGRAKCRKLSSILTIGTGLRGLVHCNLGCRVYTHAQDLVLGQTWICTQRFIRRVRQQFDLQS